MLEVRKSTTLSGTISLEEETVEGTQKNTCALYIFHYQRRWLTKYH